MENEKSTKRVTWQRVCLIILCVLLALILTAMIAATAYVHHLLSYITGDDNSHLNETLPPEVLATATSSPGYIPGFTGPSTEYVPQDTLPPITDDKEIVNILLIGEDRKGEKYRQRSDSMILCSFNTKTNKMTMISFLRDTYIAKIPGYWADKLNAAYQYGGPFTLKQTLAAYFGVHVDACVMVQFEGFIGVIDMLGGVDINLTAKEAKYMNENNQLGWDLKPGLNHFDGVKALFYSRIRKIDMDAKRAQRQRNVLTALINAYKNKPLTEMITLTEEIVATGFVETDMSAEEIMYYTRKLFPMLSSMSIGNQQIPAEGTYQSMAVGNVVDAKVCDLDANRKILAALFK
ncbi:MAG: LytR family transcriptional regulator [Ruminococcaceae bacterium]|nr:LytR family transcriptional regulator [Oscillospiraceae bacterium]